jgi:hypothetical protein
MVPDIEGLWEVKGFYISYETPTSTVDLNNPTIYPKTKVVIKQNGRFFTYRKQGDDSRLAKLGVMEKVYLNGKFAGWKGHMVDAQYDNENFIFNFSRICDNVVKKFDITYTESGFSKTVPDQTPRVEYAIAKRLSK